MIRPILALLACLVWATPGACSQPVPVRGIVVTATSNEPLAGALARLIRQDDPVVELRAESDWRGQFEFSSVSSGAYNLVVSFSGFAPDSLSLVVDGSVPVDLGALALEQEALRMEELVVVGQAPTIVKGLEKQIYSVDADLFSASSSATEVIQNIPSVSVDINNNITLRNSGNVTVLVNGKPTALLRRNPGSVLDQMSAGNIDHIEIITNPSAKYRPDGVGGIINIVLKKSSDAGTAGQIGANVGNENRVNASLSGSHTTGKVNLATGYNFRRSDGSILYTDDRVYRDGGSGAVTGGQNESGRSMVGAQSQSVSCGVDLQPDEENSIGLTGDYFVKNSFHNGQSTIAVFDPLGPGNSTLHDHRTNDEREEEWEAGLVYERSFAGHEDRSLSAEFSYSGYDESENLKSRQVFGGQIDVVGNLIRKSGSQRSYAAEYVATVGDAGELIGGYVSDFLFDDIRYSSDRYLSSRFLFNQDVHAMYVELGGSRGMIDFKGGFRAEEARISSHLVAPVDSTISNRYFKLFPSLHLSHEFEDSQVLSVSYSKRLNRPDSDELNPYPEYSDPRNAEAGNPGLKPEQIHSLELGHQISLGNATLANTLYYRYKFDAFSSIQTSVGDSLVLTTPANLRTQDAWGLESTASGSPVNWWDYSLTGDLFHTKIDAANIGYANNRSTLSGSIKGYSLLRLGGGTGVQFNAFYYLPTITPQGRRASYFYLNVGLKQQLLDRRATMSLTVTDLFYSYRIKQVVDSPELSQTTTIKRRVPVVYLGLTWRFNGAKENQPLFEGEGLRR